MPFLGFAEYEHFVPSILDRLLDDEPQELWEPLPNRFQNLSQLKKAVARDLEALLNTRQEILEELPSEFTRGASFPRHLWAPRF